MLKSPVVWSVFALTVMWNGEGRNVAAKVGNGNYNRHRKTNLRLARTAYYYKLGRAGFRTLFKPGHQR